MGLICEADAEFIAHARDDIPFLLAEHTRLSKRVEELEGEVKILTSVIDRTPSIAEFKRLEAMEQRAVRVIGEHGHIAESVARFILTGSDAKGTSDAS